MKKLTACILLFLTSFPVFAQNSHSEILERFLSQRKKMMEEIMKAFNDDDFFKDDFFKSEDLFDSFQFKGFQGAGDNIKIEEEMGPDGTINVFITPQKENQSLNIETRGGMIVIRGENIVEEKIEGTNNSASVFRSKFTKSVTIPDGYEALEPVKDGNRLKIALKPHKQNPLRPDSDGRIPVPKRQGEETI